MRSLAVVLVVPFLACGVPAKDGEGDKPDAGVEIDGGTMMMPPSRGFQITSPTVDIDAGKDVTYCYYFHTANDVDMSIKRWASHMTAGAHDVILYLTPTDQKPPNTLLTTDCAISNGTTGPVWTYSAQTPDAEAAMPADDGEGNPVGQPISASHSGFLQMHYVNTTAAVIHAHIELTAYAYDDGVQVTPAGPFVTLNRHIDLKSGTMLMPTPGLVNGMCDVLPDDTSGKPPTFFAMTTYTHKQGVHTFVKDGSTTIFDSTDWENPGAATWTPPSYLFSSSQLMYQCEYRNPTSREIMTGDSATEGEMCMAIGFYFPATGGTGHFCLNSQMLY